MATELETGPPPPPPPLPGTSGALVLPHWRDTYQPNIRESAPSKEQIEKQQYAHLPDKLLNTMNKDKKPFTYTPQGASSERGVLDLSEIRSPKMKKRLMANLHTGEDETDQSSDERSSPSNMKSNQPVKPSMNLFQQPINPMVLPPITDNNRLQVRSPSPLMGQNKKEVRFAPSPIMASDDEELANVLQKRKQDVESRSKIVTNEPIVDNNNQLNSNNSDDAQQMQFDVDELVKRSSEAVQTARNLFGSMPNSLPNNNNNLVNKSNLSQQTNAELPPYQCREEEVTETINQIENNLNGIHLNDPQPSTLFSNTLMHNVDVNSKMSNVRSHCQSPTSVPQLFAPNPPNRYDPGVQNGNSSAEVRKPIEQCDILKQVLDDGLQEEIDKFEQISRETAMSPVPNVDIYRNLNQSQPCPVPFGTNSSSRKQAPPPVPPKPKIVRDGRTSCPPYTEHQQHLLDNDFANSFRCISPSFEILKKTQSSGYNYITKPRPFYRSSNDRSQDSSSAFRPVSQLAYNEPTFNSFKPIDEMSNSQYNPNEESTTNYGSLPRKIKLNRDLTQPKTYDNKEAGREFLSNIGIYSQLPPKPNNDTNSNNAAQNNSPLQSPKMFYGSQTVPRKINITGRNPLNQPKTYENPESGREYLSNIGMYSQLSPQKNENSPESSLNGFSNGFHSGTHNHYVNRRQTSLPPSVNRLSGTYMQIASSTPPPPMANQNPVKPSKLTMNQIRKLPPSERPPEPNPSKYTGSHIPSRSFRILQLITGEDIENQYANNIQTKPNLKQKATSVSTKPVHNEPVPDKPARDEPVSSYNDYGTDF